MKRQWGVNDIMKIKGKQRASADVGLLFCIYNLRRILNLIDKKVLIFDPAMPSQILILDMNGNTQLQNTYANARELHNISVSNLSTGTYFLIIQQGDFVQSAKCSSIL